MYQILNRILYMILRTTRVSKNFIYNIILEIFEINNII